MKGFHPYLMSMFLYYSALLVLLGHAVLPPGPSLPTKEFNLAAEWAAISGNPALEVATGSASAFELEMGKSKSFITTSLFGCTVAVLMGPNGVVIGHLAEDAGAKVGGVVLPGGAREACITIESPAKTDEFIKKHLDNQGLKVELSHECHEGSEKQLYGYILYSTGVGGTPAGVAVLRKYMESQFIPRENTVVQTYIRSSNAGADFKGTLQKFLVRWLSPNSAGGGTLEIYRFSNTPVLTIHYDAEGHQIGVAQKRAKFGKSVKTCRRPFKGSSNLKSTATTAKKTTDIPVSKSTTLITKAKATSSAEQLKPSPTNKIKPPITPPVKNLEQRRTSRPPVARLL